MSRRAAVFSTTSLIFMGTLAQADVTPDQIWSDWKNYWSGFGYTVNATETTSGDTLTVSNMAMRFPVPEGEGDVTLSMDKIDFVQNADGTVSLVFPSVMPMTVATKPAFGDKVNAVVEYTLDNMDMVASGSIDDLLYTYTADAIGLTLKELTVGDETLGGNAFLASFTSQDLTGTTKMAGSSLREVVQTMALGATDYTVSFSDPDSDASFSMVGQMAGLNMTGDSRLPKAMDPNDMPAALEKGLSASGTFTTRGSSVAMNMSEGGRPTVLNGSSDTSEFAFAMNGAALEYSSSMKAAKMSASGGEVPLPLEFQLGELGFDLLMPIAKSDDPADFGLGLVIGDFVTSDMLWSLIDPSNTLPRDPATIAFDLSGKAKMLVDFFDPEQMAAVEDGDVMPAEVSEVTLNKLLVTAAGAMLTGDGAFTLDNENTGMFGGMPTPAGTLNVQLEGGMSLLDKLVSMGLVPQEQAMGARMMLGLFARPGAGEDTLTSKIEITEEGHILANGQRIQ